MLTALCVVLALIAVAAWPAWPHSRAWGYVPAAGVVFVLLCLIAMHLLNMI